MRVVFFGVLFLALSSCHVHKFSANLPDLPLAMSNNAVALVQKGKGIELYSFNGLLAGKSWQDISNKVFKWSQNRWTEIQPPALAQNVLASTAVSVGEMIYIIGGYTVAQDGKETSIANILQYNSQQNSWSVLSKMPVAVDDTVALVYKQRYLYLVSGWHDTDNVSLVQVFDLQLKRWSQASAFPLPAVFGHSGGIVDNKILICDGVKVVKNSNKRDFVASPECALGVVDVKNPAVIHWQKIAHHSTRAYYRMAAVGDAKNQRFVFAGGSDNPYNYDGIGYNKIPSKPSSHVFVYDLKNERWHDYPEIIAPSMDHRALLFDGDWYYIIGGMRHEQKVSAKIEKFKLH